MLSKKVGFMFSIFDFEFVYDLEFEV